MLTLPSIIAGVAGLVALAAWMRARAVTRRLERLTESYWELRYESGQLKSRLLRLEEAAGLAVPEAAPSPKAASTTTFVPLSSLKK